MPNAAEQLGRRNQQAEQQQGPHESRYGDHGDDVPHSTQGSVSFEEPRLHQIARHYQKERYGLVRVVQRS